MIEHPEARRRIAATARRMSRVSLAACLFVIAGYIALWTDIGWARSALGEALPGIATAGVTRWQLGAGFALGAMPAALLAAALWRIRQFFELYRQGEVFPAEAARRLRSFGGLLAVLAVASPIVRAVASVLFSWHLGDGQKRLAISLSSSDMFVLIVAGLVMMVGRVLFEAARLAEENRQFV